MTVFQSASVSAENFASFCKPGIRDDDIDGAEALHDGIEHRVDLGFVGHVRADGERFAAFRRDRGGEFFGRFRVRVIVDGDVRARVGERGGDARADARTRARHERDLACQGFVHVQFRDGQSFLGEQGVRPRKEGFSGSSIPHTLRRI